MALRPRYFDNARLAVDLALLHGAKGTDAGSMSHFCATEPGWYCPGCGRTKAEIARLDRRGIFYCALHNHHDHIFEGRLEMMGLDFIRASDEDLAVATAGVRFDTTFVCMDCNMADARAKKVAKAPKFFSYSPSEIAQLIIVQPNGNHELLRDAPEGILREVIHIYEEAINSVRANYNAERRT